MTIRVPPLDFDSDPTEHRRQIARAVQRLINRTQFGRVSFANGSTSTVLRLNGLRPSTGHVTLTPLNATARDTAFVAGYADNQATFTYTDPGADASFSYLAVLG